MASKREKARQNIMDAAEKLFAANGFDATSVESIAAEAGVNKALIYYYFKDKNDIVRSLFTNIITELGEHLKQAEPPPGVPVGLTGMKEKIRQEIRFLEDRGRIITILFMEALKGGDRDGFLFQCADLVINHELEAFKGAFKAKRETMPDPEQYRVYEFFTGVMPVLAFVMFKEKWQDYFDCPEERLMDMFLNAFTQTHLIGHGLIKSE